MYANRTDITIPDRGSMILNFLSLLVVANKDPSLLNDMQYITSV